MELYNKNVDKSRNGALKKVTFGAMVICALAAGISQNNAPDLEDLANSRQISTASVTAYFQLRDHIKSTPSNVNIVSAAMENSSACFTDLVDTSPDLSGLDDKMRDSVVMLHLVYESEGQPFIAQGSGTIITGDNGQKSILTAAHVVDTAGGELKEVVAYNHEGLAIGNFQVTFSGNSHFAGDDPNLPDKLFQDIAVLHPLGLYGEVGVDLWNDGGLQLSKEQSDSTLAIYPSGRAYSISKGLSGAGVVNAAGEIIGVIDQKVAIRGEPHHFDKGNYVNSLMNVHNSGYLSNDIIQSHEMLVNFAYDSDTFEHAVGVALPVVNDLALQAMGYNPDNVEMTHWKKSRILEAQTAGFPSATCQDSEMVVTAMNNIKVSRETQPEYSTVKDIPEPYIPDQPYYSTVVTVVDPFGDAGMVAEASDPFSDAGSFPTFLEETELSSLSG